MTTYSEDFAGMTTGVAPTNFTNRFTTTSQTWTVENPSDGEAEDDRAFRFVHTANAIRLFSFDGVDSDANREDSEIVVRWRLNDADATNGITFWLNGSGSAGSEDGYVVKYEHIFSAESWQLSRYDAGTITDLVNATWDDPTPSGDDSRPIVDEWYYCRFRKNGTALQFRVWKDDALEDESEPTDWLIDTTDSDLDVDGWVGVGCDNQDQFEVDYVGIGTAGDTAPIDTSTNTAVRLTAAYASVLHSKDTTPVRLTAAYAAVLTTKPTTPVRITAAYAAVLYSQATPVDFDYVIPVSWLQSADPPDCPLEGDGSSEAEPIYLHDITELKAMDLTKHYALANDIDINADDWVPLGAATTTFDGSLDGRGYKIYNLHSTYVASHCGLFWQILTGTIRRLGVETTAAGITGQSSALYTGVLAGYGNQAGHGWLVEDCWVEGKVDTGGDRAGGLMGLTDSSNGGASILRRNRIAVHLSGTIGVRVGGVTGFGGGAELTDSDNYFDSDIATTTALGAGGGVPIAKTTTLMQEEATFTGFDFDDVWFISEAATYPFLFPVCPGIPVEWTAELEIDRIIPVEWRQGIAADRQIPVEWTLETGAIESDHLIPVEWTTELAIDRIIPVEWKGELRADSAIPVEWHLELNIDRQIPFEWNTAFVPHDSQIPAEWRSGVAQNHQTPINWAGEVQPPHDSVIPYAWRGPFADPGSDYPVLFEWKLDLDTDHLSPVEYQTQVDKDHQNPVEWLLETVLVSTHQIPINWAGVLDSDKSIPVEWTTELEIDRIIPYDWQLTVFLELDRQMPIEWKLDVVTDNSIPVAWFLQLRLDHQIPVGWRGEFSAVDFVIPYEWTQGVALNASIPVEWNVDLLPDFIIPVEWTVDVGDENSIPVEWLSPALASDHQIPIAWFSPVLFDQVMPVEWLQESFVQLNSEIPIEWQQIFFKKFDQIIPWEARGILDPTEGTMPVEWRSDPGFDAGIPVEWTDPLFALFVTRDAEDCEFWLADCNSVGWEAIRCASLWLADELPHEAQSAEESGGTWTARNEEIGGTWFAQERQSNWEAPCLPTVWLSDPPNVWYAEDCPAMWFAQEQPVRWAAESQAARWIVLEPNTRGDI